MNASIYTSFVILLSLSAVSPPVLAEAGKDNARLQAPLKASPGEMRDAKVNALLIRLASPEGKDAAPAVAQAIQEIWLDSGSDTANLLMQRAMTASTAQNIDVSHKLLTAVVSIQPDYAEGWAQLAGSYFRRRQFQEAVPHLMRAIALEPRHFKALEGYGAVMREMGNKTAALGAFRRLLTIHPHNAAAQMAERELAREVEGQKI